MSIFDFLNPLDKNKKRTYQDLSKDSKQVNSKPPSELLIASHNLTGTQLQEHMSILNDCHWIRAEYTYPAFDNMNFAYKNQIFSIIIDIQDDEGNSYLPEHYIQNQITASKEHNLIPCKFPIKVNNPHNPDLKTITPLTNGWNLFHTITNEKILPEYMASEDKIPVSNWERRNFAIICMRKYLSSMNCKMLSYQDTLEVDPQMWFETPDGKKNWLIIRCNDLQNKTAQKPDKLNEIIRRCFSFDGYFAGINLKTQNKKLYRGDTFDIEFKGLEKVHSTL